MTGKPIKYAGSARNLAESRRFIRSAWLPGYSAWATSFPHRGGQKGLTRKGRRVRQKLKSGKGFDLNDFKQMGQMRKMGALGLLDKMPAQVAQMAGSSRQVPKRRWCGGLRASSIR